MRKNAGNSGKIRRFTNGLRCAIITAKLNNAYEECARDKPCDRTTTAAR